MSEAHPIEIALYPTSDQIQTLLAGPQDRPVVMLNLLKFKRDARGDRAAGEAEYRHYADQMVVFVQSKGGRIIWTGRVDSQVLGTGAEDFDMAALVEYPSRQAFVAIATDPYVEKIGAHRTAGLEGQWLLATSTEPM